MKRTKKYQSLGLCYYSTNSDGIGGTIRQVLKDFLVEEISLDNKISYCFKTIKNLNFDKSAPFLRFSLIKYGLDNLNALRLLADELKISANFFGFAGMKDKSAVTSQFISIKNMNLDKLENIQIKNIELRNFHTSNTPLKIGSLFGNHFIITIRNLEEDVSEIKEKIKHILNGIELNGGLINYYGIQRFGDVRPISHLVGKEILKKNYEEAVKIYLAKVYPDENPDAKLVRTELNEDWNFKKGLENFPKHLIYEKLMLKSLVKFPNNYKKALEALPKRLQTMLLFSYQSFLFNKILSNRKEQNLEFKELRINDNVLILDEFGLPTNAIFQVSEKNFEHLNNLINNNKAKIAAPLIGFQTEINHDYIKQIIKEEEIKLTDFKSSIPYFNRQGNYRPILFSPINLNIKNITEDDINPHRNKVILDFSLKRGYYASIVLEEFMKNKKLKK